MSFIVLVKLLDYIISSALALAKIYGYPKNLLNFEILLLLSVFKQNKSHCYASEMCLVKEAGPFSIVSHPIYTHILSGPFRLGQARHTSFKMNVSQMLPSIQA